MNDFFILATVILLLVVIVWISSVVLYGKFQRPLSVILISAVIAASVLAFLGLILDQGVVWVPLGLTWLILFFEALPVAAVAVWLIKRKA